MLLADLLDCLTANPNRELRIQYNRKLYHVSEFCVENGFISILSFETYSKKEQRMCDISLNDLECVYGTDGLRVSILNYFGMSEWSRELEECLWIYDVCVAKGISIHYDFKVIEIDNRIVLKALKKI